MIDEFEHTSEQGTNGKIDKLVESPEDIYLSCSFSEDVLADIEVKYERSSEVHIDLYSNKSEFFHPVIYSSNLSISESKSEEISHQNKVVFALQPFTFSLISKNLTIYT